MNARELILGPNYLSAKRLIHRTSRWPKERLEELQYQKLRNLLVYAVNHISYYKNVDRAFLEADNCHNLISYFFYSDKNTIAKYFNKMISSVKYRRRVTNTGGSTGQPMVFYQDRFVTRQREKAFIFDMWSRIGYKVGDKIVNLRGRTPKRGKLLEHSWLLNTYFLSSFDLYVEKLDQYIKLINKIQPKFLHGYPSTLFQFAQLLKAENKRLDINLKGVFCGSEKLFPYQREMLESVFQCRPYNWYGHSEYAVLAGECEHTTDLHFFPQYGYTEFHDTGLQHEGKPLYEIVATGFNNRVMPFIRYRTGDYCTLKQDARCSCGRNYDIAEEVLGRQQEFVVDKNGHLISATALLFGQHFKLFNGLSSFKAVQEEEGKLTLVMVKNELFEEEQFQEFERNVSELLKDRLAFDYEFVNEDDRTETGKSKTVEQHLDMNNYM